jgi:hypothetical protein
MIILPHRRKAFRGGGTFDPTSIAGLELWLDASDSSTLFDATSGGSLPGDGGNVKRWEDKSGNGRHATEATNPPIRSVGLENGLDALVFDNTNDFLATAAFNTSDEMTFFLVTKPGAAPPDYARLVEQGGNNGWNIHTWGATYTTHGIHTGSPTGLAFSTARQLITIYATGSPTRTTSIARDGGSDVTSTSTNFPSASLAFFVNRFGGGGFHHGQNACEMLLYNSALGTPDREAVEAYLMTKWGIA